MQLAPVPLLPGKHGVEERIAADIPLLLDVLHQFFEGIPLVVKGMQAILPYFLQIVEHNLRSIRAAAEGQRVDKSPHRVFRIHAQTTADRRADQNLLLSTVFC
ncbi:hypothetical protein D3C75_1176720 [compost metagenome]